MSTLKCPGVGRDKDCSSALQFYFNRPVTDVEMRFLHDVMQRAVACAKGGPTKRYPNRPYCKDDQTCCDFCCGN